MSSEKKTTIPSYQTPVEGQVDTNTKIYHVHTPFTPPIIEDSTQVQVNSEANLEQTAGRQVLRDVDQNLDFYPGKAYCPSCQQYITTEVTYKAGTYAWLMCLLFICFGLVLCCCLIPFFVNRFKDATHTCPRCNRILHTEKRQCCK